MARREADAAQRVHVRPSVEHVVPGEHHILIRKPHVELVGRFAGSRHELEPHAGDRQ